MDDDIEKSPFSCFFQSAGLELEQNMQALLTLMQEEEEDGDHSFSQKKQEIFKRVQDSHTICHSLLEHFDKLSFRSTLTSPDSNPDSVIEDPELEPSGFGALLPNDKFEIFRLVEESTKYLDEMTRRNEEKRKVIGELSGQIERLMEENQMLVEQQQKLRDEHRALLMKLTGKGEELQIVSNRRSMSQLGRLKSLVLGSIWGGDSYC